MSNGITGYQWPDIQEAGHLDFIPVLSGPAASSQDPTFLHLENELATSAGLKDYMRLDTLTFKSKPGIEDSFNK